MANEYGNYGTFNPNNDGGSAWRPTLTNGNRTISSVANGTQNNYHASTLFVPANDSSGFYCEFNPSAVPTADWRFALFGDNFKYGTNSEVTNSPGAWGYNRSGTYDSQESGAGAGSASGTAWTASNIVMILIKNGKIYFGLDGTFENSGNIANETGFIWQNITGNVCPGIGCNASASTFAGELITDPALMTHQPSGTKSFGTANLPTPAIINSDDHFFSGTVATSTSSNVTTTVPFNLDDYEWLMIVKNTTSTGSWVWVNSFIGTGKFIRSNGNNAQGDLDWLSVSGTTFTISTAIGVEDTFIVEIHKAGLKSASAANTVGSLNTTETSVNATSGFSMGVYEGEGANATIGTGLSTAYDFLAVKNLDSGQGWRNWHVGLTNGTKYARFDSTAAEATEAATWNSTAPAATVFSIGTAANTSQDDHTILYFGWHSVPFYSAFGKYTGNGATDGAFVNLGGHPNSMFFRSQNAGDNWYYHNSSVNPTNPVTSYIAFNTTAASASFTSHDRLSNGIKARNANSGWNFSGTVLYGAWGIRSLTDGGINQGRAK